MAKILIVEDDSLSCLNLSAMLAPHGEVESAYDSLEAKELLTKIKFDIAFIDLDLEKELAGLDLIAQARKKGIYTVILTGREEDENIRQAYQLGCQDYLSKPFSPKSLSYILQKFQLSNKSEIMQQLWSEIYVTQDKKLMKDWETLIPQILISDRPVMLTGETGTGKTLIAKFIHRFSRKHKGPLIHLNCSEIPESLIESELFGHEKGAFSGAVSAQKGKLELANGGVLFLDEIGTMPPGVQKKLLKALEEKSFYRLGGTQVIHSDFRLVSATCDQLDQMVRIGQFRQDLYFRIDGHRLHLTPIRERPQDIPVLVKYFLRQGSRRIVVTTDALQSLEKYTWPGNVRELQKTVGMLQQGHKGIIDVKDLPKEILESEKAEAVTVVASSNKNAFLTPSQIDFVSGNGLPKLVKEIEKETISHFYQKNMGQVRPTVKKLKISNALFYKTVKTQKSPV